VAVPHEARCRSATDGHALSQPRKMSEFFVGPGERIDAIAVGPPAGELSDADPVISE
jgi:hypothetical protein